MQEIVPPKLNKDTGTFSLIINRKNFVIGIIVLCSLLLWSSISVSTDTKIILELLLIIVLSPFLFNTYGRPLHRFIFDWCKFVVSKKEQTITTYEEINNGIVKVSQNYYIKIYRIEPINLSMSSTEEIEVFKRYMQQALFSLLYPVQIITVQKYSNNFGSSIDLKKYEHLQGKLKACANQYFREYKNIPPTFERSFYLVVSILASNQEKAERKLEEQFNSFGRLLEQTKVKLLPVSDEEISDLYKYILENDAENN